MSEFIRKPDFTEGAIDDDIRAAKDAINRIEAGVSEPAPAADTRPRWVIERETERREKEEREREALAEKARRGTKVIKAGETAMDAALSERLQAGIRAKNDLPLEKEPTPGVTVIPAGEFKATGEISDMLKTQVGKADLPERVVIRGKKGSLMGTFDTPRPFPVREPEPVSSIQYDRSTADTLSPIAKAATGLPRYPKEVPVAVDRRNEATKDLKPTDDWRDESPDTTRVDGFTSRNHPSPDRRD